MPDAVQICGLSLVVEGRVVLEDISISFPDNTLTVIFGPNGAGKSSLLKVLIGELKPSKGEIKIFGKQPHQVRSLIGYVPQELYALRDFPISALDAVITGRYGKIGIFRRITKRDKEAAMEALGEVGLKESAMKPLASFSGGEIQRVFIARALCGNPRLLLLDEAASGVDATSKESLYELLARLKKDMAIIFVSHDMSVISHSVDKVACLDKRLISHGNPAEALTSSALNCMYGEDISTFSHCHLPHVHVKSHKEKEG